MAIAFFMLNHIYMKFLVIWRASAALAELDDARPQPTPAPPRGPPAVRVAAGA